MNSALEGLTWEFPVAEMIDWFQEIFPFVLPILLVLLGVYLAFLILERATDFALKVLMKLLGINDPEDIS